MTQRELNMFDLSITPIYLMLNGKRLPVEYVEKRKSTEVVIRRPDGVKVRALPRYFTLQADGSIVVQ